MKAALLKEPEKFFIGEYPDPVCPSDGLLVQVEACAICGTDIRVYHYGHRLIQFPRITGHEVSGTIVEAGKEVKGYKEGERVAVAAAVPCGCCAYCRRGMQSMCDNLTAFGYTYDGGFARYMVVPEVAVRNGCVNPFPEQISFAEAAIVEPLACCVNGQELSDVKLGDTVVVIGAGPVGCFHVQLARVRGATRVIMVDISSKKLLISRFAQADVYVDASREDPVAKVRNETGGRGADVIITACSSGKAQEQGVEMVAKRGNINFFGGLPKDAPYIRFNSNLPHYCEFSVVGTHGSSPIHNQLALDLISSGRIDAGSLVTEKLPLDDLIEGLKKVEGGETLKVIIEPGR